jgi:hypothetical protein
MMTRDEVLRRAATYGAACRTEGRMANMAGGLASMNTLRACGEAQKKASAAAEAAMSALVEAIVELDRQGRH